MSTEPEAGYQTEEVSVVEQLSAKAPPSEDVPPVVESPTSSPPPDASPKSSPPQDAAPRAESAPESKPAQSAPEKKKAKVATEETKMMIKLSLAGLGFLAVVLLFFTEGIWNPVHLSLPFFLIGYRVFYHFFPHDWEKEKYYMSHLHLFLALALGLYLMPVFQLNEEHMCQNADDARWISMNSVAYFVIDTTVLIDTIWITHHTLTLGTALFGCAGNVQVSGGSVYIWYAEIGGLLYHISRMWPKSKRVREIFLISYFISRMCMLWIASISWRCTMTRIENYYSAEFVVNVVCSCFTTGIALVNLKFLRTNVNTYIKTFWNKKKEE